jgi:hypothetical protein
MRGIERSCGHHLHGADDDELFRRARARIAAEACELEPVAGS